MSGQSPRFYLVGSNRVKYVCMYAHMYIPMCL